MTRRIKCLVLYCCRLLGLFALARLGSRGQLRILCYHGFELDDESAFRPKLFMTRATFERRMRTLVARGVPVLTLSEGLRSLHAGELPAGAVVVTIDDGFFSVREVAAPILRQLGLPSTLYVSTYYVQKQTPIFQVLIQYLLWKARRRAVDFGSAAWAPSERLDLADSAAVARFADQMVTLGNRLQSERERQKIAQELARTLGVELAPIAAARTMSLLTAAELRALDRDGMAVELHTHRHRFPPDDSASCRRELADNCRVLEQALGRRPVHFCYPSGLWQQAHFKLLADSGVASATTCDAGLNDTHTHRFALRRFLDSEVITQIEFEAELAGFSDILRRARTRLFGRPPSAGYEEH